MDSKLYTEIISSRIEEMRILWEYKINLQFDNNPKHKNLQADEFINKIVLEL